MGKKGEETQKRILDIAEEMILRKGFTGTSIDEIINRADITKGGFFYHFKGKGDLAKRLLQRYLEADDAFFAEMFERAESLSEDPLHQMLIFLKLYSEIMADMVGKNPGCLVAAYIYESQQFDDEINTLAAEGVLSWRAMFAERFKRIADCHPLKVDVPFSVLADMLISIIEGGIVVSRVFSSQEILAQQLLQFRLHVRLLFGDV